MMPVLKQLAPVVILAFTPLAITCVIKPFIIVHVLVNLAGMVATSVQDMSRATRAERLAFFVFFSAFVIAPLVLIFCREW